MADFSFLNTGPGDDEDGDNIGGEPTVMPPEAQDQESRKKTFSQSQKLSSRLRQSAVDKANNLANTAHMYQLHPKDRAIFDAVKPSFYGKAPDQVNLPGVADDLDQIAQSPTLHPEFAGKLLRASSALRQADAAEADQMHRQQVGDEEGDFSMPGGAAADPEKLNAEADKLNKQVESLNAQISRSGVLQANQLIQERNQLDQKARNLRLQATSAGDQGQPEFKDVVDHSLNMNAVLTAAGWDRQDFIQANTEVRRIIGTHGINPTDPVTPSTFGIIVPKIVEEVFKPEQAKKFFEEIVGPEQQEGDDKGKQKPSGDKNQDTMDSGLKDVNKRLAESQARHDAVWRELAHSGNFNNVGDVIGFILTSLVLGPRAGAALFSNMNKNGGLKSELQQIDRETTQLFHQQNSYIQLTQRARQQAVQEEHQKDQLKEAKRHNEVIEGKEYWDMRNLARKIQDPEMRNIATTRLHGLRIAESNLKADKENLDRLEKAANNPMDPRFKTAKAAVLQETKNYAIKVQEMKQYRSKLQAWFEENANKVGGVLRPSSGVQMQSVPQGFDDQEE